MSANLQRHHEFTKEEYWQHQRISNRKYEYFDGIVFAMANDSDDHNRIAVDVTISLANQLRDKPCEVFAADQRIEVEKTTLQTYPDVLVACPPFSYDAGDKHTMTDCVVIIEVLSPSTANYDRNEKFDNYKQLKSLRHYLLIEQKQIKVTHHYKDGNEQWHSETFVSLDDVAALAAVDCQLELREIYRRIDLTRVKILLRAKQQPRRALSST